MEMARAVCWHQRTENERMLGEDAEQRVKRAEDAAEIANRRATEAEEKLQRLRSIIMTGAGSNSTLFQFKACTPKQNSTSPPMTRGGFPLKRRRRKTIESLAPGSRSIIDNGLSPFNGPADANIKGSDIRRRSDLSNQQSERVLGRAPRLEIQVTGDVMDCKASYAKATVSPRYGSHLKLSTSAELTILREALAAKGEQLRELQTDEAENI